MTYAIAHTLTQPIADLRRAAVRVGGGDLSTRVPVRGTDELGQVAHAFNAMVAGLGERERLRARVAEEERRSERLLYDLPIGVLLLDGERRLLFANREAQALLPPLGGGRPGEALLRLGDAPLDELLARPDGSGRDVAIAGEPRRVIEVRAAGPGAGAATGEALVVLRDVTADRARQDQLVRHERLAVVGQLAAGVAHDFNNLLAAITSYASFAADGLEDPAQAREDLAEVQHAAKRAVSLTRQLLTFSRREVTEPRVLDLRRVVADLEKMLRRLIGEAIRLDTVVEPGLGRVKADAGQIEQILVNLVVNARDAMPRGGRITVEAANRTGADGARRVMIAVQDTGCGMTDEVRARIFEPFFTPGRGTGLGLATVHGIVRRLGGTIEVESQPGRGSRFRVELPATDEAPAGEAGAARATGRARRGETVLVVEDDASLRGAVTRMLEGAGYRVLAAADGNSIECRAEAPIDLLLTDVVMPGMSGRELADRLRAARPGLRVLYMSGYTDDAIVHHGVLEDRLHFLQKPFTSEALLGKVRAALDAELA